MSDFHIPQRAPGSTPEPTTPREAELLLALQQVTDVLDAFGNLPDSMIHPAAWNQYCAEDKVKAARVVLATAHTHAAANTAGLSPAEQGRYPTNAEFVAVLRQELGIDTPTAADAAAMSGEVLAKIWFHPIPEESDYEVHDSSSMPSRPEGCSKCIEAVIVARPWVDNRAPATSAAALSPVEGDKLPPVGSKVLVHLGRQDEWVEHTVTGYYAWGDLGGNDSLHRVFVRVVDADGYPNARLLKDVRPTAKGTGGVS